MPISEGGATETPYWLGFHLVPGIGATRLARLIEHFGSLERAWHATPAALRASGLGERALDSLVTTRARLSLDVEMQRVERDGVHLLTLAHDEYPRLLREISSPPTVLYVRGSLTPEDENAVAIVGTRRVTSYGREMSRRFGMELATSGVTVVSGLARGVDGIAHSAALDAGGRTIAVLGCGLDTIYPPEHRALAERIVEQGALVSEFSLGTTPEAANFPVRNRIISGLSLGIVVIEAPMKSGALITSNFAADQGRTVFAVPGSALSNASAGTIQLLRDGATVAANGNDVLSALNLGTRQVEMETRQLLPSNDVERTVLLLLTGEPKHIDEIAIESGLQIGTLSAQLLQMQLKGLVRNVGTQHYVRG
ncbi:MAG TPA: DNA-processing protein DprA [Nitrolancea sp.]|nr:DNA-processing protein DprA [Nitrolancea sp.]